MAGTAPTEKRRLTPPPNSRTLALIGAGLSAANDCHVNTWLTTFHVAKTSAAQTNSMAERRIVSTNLASNLVGKNINGWHVVEKILKEDTTGGAFSSGYVVHDDKGRKAFMKAINIGYAINMHGRVGNLTDLINSITEDFKYERDLLTFCGNNRMDRVVLAIASGEYVEQGYAYFVPYLVFEYCREGDVRRQTQMFDPGLAWRLHVFHGVCVGVHQLHSKEVAHQDLKPSNILVFNGTKAKIADLGRSTRKGPNARFDADDHCGHVDYTPIELQYHHHETDWDTRRKGADLYMLGGILGFLLSNVHIFSLILEKIPPTHHPRNWRGGNYKSILPVLETATYDAISEIVASLPTELQVDIRNLLLWLCNPDPAKRGHPQTLEQPYGPRFSLERIITIADRLAKTAHILSK